MRHSIIFEVAIAIIFLQINEIKGQWIKTNGPYGGQVRCIGINGTNIFAGTDNGDAAWDWGMFLSVNNGKSWSNINSGIHDAPLSIAFSRKNVFIGTSGGVYLTSDNGTNWNPVNTGLKYGHIRALLVLDTNIFAGGENGVFRSTNNGLNWTEVDSGLPETNITAFAITQNGNNVTNLFAATGSGIFLSTNSGAFWTAVNDGLTDKYISSLIVFPNETNRPQLLAGTLREGVFMSDNNGATWIPVNSGLIGRQINALAVSLNINGYMNFFAGTDSGVFRSTNKGIDWLSSDSGLTNMNINCFSVSDTNLYLGTMGNGVFLSTDGGKSWNPSSIGLTSPLINALACSGENLYAGTNSNIYISTDTGTNWIQLNPVISNRRVNALAANTATPEITNLFAGTYNGLWLSSDNGRKWSSIDLSRANNMVSIAISDSLMLAGTSNYDSGRIYLSTNNGSNWTSVYSTPTVSILDFAFSGNNIYAGTSNGILQSTDNGTGWGPNYEFIPYVYCLANSDENLYAGTDDGIYVFNKNTNGIQLNHTGLIDTPISDFAVYNNETGGTYLFASSYQYGVFLSTNNGINWTAVNTGLTRLLVHTMCICGTNLYVGTDGAGVWKRPLSELLTSVEKLPAGLQMNFNLSQNYPNPFNGTTNIIYSIPKATFVTIKVYDILGKEIATLVKEEKKAGSYEVEFNGSNLVSGIYFYRMKAGDFIQTKKIILMK
ncbi:MAG: T9SS type A sorting domain-containing protein [Ignavibacteriaceae bacterium]